MHSAAQNSQSTSPVSAAASNVNKAAASQVQQAGLTATPMPVSPIGYAGLAALVGLAAGMVLAPWLEKWYRKLGKKQHGGEDE
jgi:hypothetical protein